ncbi:MAG: SHOCT domain-containing protein [Planctomycetota bacterium]
MVGLLIAAAEVWGQTPPPTGPVENNPREVFFWAGVLVVAAALVALAFMLIRKRLRALDDEPAAINPMGFTLADLREMHAQGQMSDEEFDFAKRKMLARTKAQLGDETDSGEEPEVVDLGDISESSPNDSPPETPPGTTGDQGEPGDTDPPKQ